MTYFEAISALQQRGLDTIKVTQSTQVASLRAARELTAVLAASPMPEAPKLLRAMNELTTSFTFQMLEAQVVYAKQLADMLAEPAKEADVIAPAIASVPVVPVAASAYVEEPAAPAEAMVVATFEPSLEEVLSKTLPAPPSQAPIPVGQTSNTDAALEPKTKRKLPTVSNNRTPPKRNPGTK